MWWPPKPKKRGKERKRGSNMSLVGDVYCHHKIIELFGRKEGKGSITVK
jgi:hypothetical protein